MFALFLAVTFALALLGWAEFAPRSNRAAQAQGQDKVTAQRDANTADDLPAPKRSPKLKPKFKPKHAPKRARRLRLKWPSLTFRRKDRQIKAMPDAPVAPLEELRAATQSSAPPAQAELPSDRDAEIMSRIEAMLEASPSAEAPASTSDEIDLPRISGFKPGDRITLELDGPAPRPDAVRFVPACSGPHAIALIADEPVLLIEQTDAATLQPNVLSFRASAA